MVVLLFSAATAAGASCSCTARAAAGAQRISAQMAIIRTDRTTRGAGKKFIFSVINFFAKITNASPMGIAASIGAFALTMIL